MTRNRLLLLLATFVLAAGVFIVLRLRPPRLPAPEAPPPAPVVAPKQPALQANAEGHYLPGYHFTVNRLRFGGFTLRPEAVARFSQPSVGAERPVFCADALIRPDSFRLRCESPQVGVVTIAGTFLTRLVTRHPENPVVSAVVTVRSGSGEVLYRARDLFTWRPPE